MKFSKFLKAFFFNRTPRVGASLCYKLMWKKFSPVLFLVRILKELRIINNSYYINSKGAFRTLSNIKDRAFCKNSERRKVVNYFRKTFYPRCLTRFWIHLWIIGDLIWCRIYSNFLAQHLVSHGFVMVSKLNQMIHDLE